MPSPKNARTLAEVRAECLALGITPGRSIAECEARIEKHKAAAPLRDWAADMAAEALPVAAEQIIAEADLSLEWMKGGDTVKIAEPCAHQTRITWHFGVAAVRRGKKRRRPKGVSIRDRREAKRRARQARMMHKARKAA